MMNSVMKEKWIWDLGTFESGENTLQSDQLFTRQFTSILVIVYMMDMLRIMITRQLVYIRIKMQL